MEKLDTEEMFEDNFDELVEDMDFKELPPSGSTEPAPTVPKDNTNVVKEDEYEVPEKYGPAPFNTYPEFSYETKGGKQVKVRHDEQGSFWHIEFVPGGQLPAELSGKYTTEHDAKLAVELYLIK